MKKFCSVFFVLFFLSGLQVWAAPGHSPVGGPPRIHAANYGRIHRPPMIRPGHRVPGPGFGRRPLPPPHIAGRPLPPPPPVYRPWIYRPYVYSSFSYPSYYYTTTYYPVNGYVYDGIEPVDSLVNTVVVRDNYAGINTAANVINAAANVASAIRFLTW